ncbi:MAG: hypothetical protein AAGF78_14010 [Pseudomonadota bacterium]
MPILAPAVPLAGGGGTLAAGGGTLATGITATQVATAGLVIASAITVGVLVDDYLDSPVQEDEESAIRTQAGAQSKADREELRDCEDCRWCQVNIQAQGTFLPLRNRSDPQGIGPYLVQGRTVYAREGVIIAGMTHEFAKGLASKRNFRQIESWGVLAATVAYILGRPPGGLPPGEYRAGRLERYATQVRYDIEVAGNINAFMA